MSDRIPEGFVLLARKIRKSPLWMSLKATHRVVMIELLLQAQFKDGYVSRNGEALFLKRGQIATSYQDLVDDIGDKDIKVKVVRNAIDKLVKHDFLAKDEAKARAKKGLLLTIVNYGVYQDAENYKGKVKDKDTGNEGAKQGQSEGKAGAINKNGNNANNANNGNKKRLVFDDKQMMLAELLWKYVQMNAPSMNQPNLNSWANIIRLMMERDERAGKDIQEVIFWSTQHSFWHKNILSADKLRKQYDRLKLQMDDEQKKVTPLNRGQTNKMPRAYQSLQDWAEGDS
jgi:hypothetical protein